jgi:two-component system sensor histidine kinase BarA
MVSGISLANKCQLLFGFAAVVILIGALAVPWFRTSSMVRDSQVEVARQVADAWLADRIHLGTLDEPGSLPPPLANEASAAAEAPVFRMSLVHVEEIDPKDESRVFLNAALRLFNESPQASEFTSTVTIDGRPFYRYARAVRESQLRAIRDQSVGSFATSPADPGISDTLRAVLVIDRSSAFAAGQLLTSRIFIIAAGIVATLLAGLVFHYILTRLIFEPVRMLRETAEKVQGGSVRIRSQIKTGDEFEQLSEAFNSMLDQMEQNQAHLKAMNESLDLKVTELSEANVGLYESNRFKSEFLANVSHELRTPLNSIIGFAELLEEMARSEAGTQGGAATLGSGGAGGGDGADSKRLRYVGNILTSGRALLEMINELLDMAKIEAGRMEVNIEPTSVGDLIEGLVGIMRPQAQSKAIEMRTVIAQRLPVIETDAGKLQQILYNFLSNAIKFTPGRGTVTISADRVTRQDNSLGVRISVADTGPGIPYDMQDVIFEKFRQIDASHTREHAGTGLGLAICRELAQMLNATVSFVSEPGRGATFFVDLPLTHQPQAPQPLMAGA